MHGDCAANHVRYNGNDVPVVDCFVINFILQNNEWWKGNGKINNSLIVSYLAKVGFKTKLFFPEVNITFKIWMKIDQVTYIKLNKIGKLFNEMLIRSWIAQKLGFLIVVVNIFYDFESLSNFSNFGVCF